MFQTKVLEKIKTHILCSIPVFVNRALYEIIWKNFVGTDRRQVTIWRTRIACWITKATATHTEYVTVVFPYQQWLHQPASYLRCIYVASLMMSQTLVLLCHYRFPVFMSASSYEEKQKMTTVDSMIQYAF
jgi:hypothetical protein